MPWKMDEGERATGVHKASSVQPPSDQIELQRSFPMKAFRSLAPIHPAHSAVAAARTQTAWTRPTLHQTRSPAPAPPAAGHSHPRSPDRASRRPSPARGWPTALRAASHSGSPAPRVTTPPCPAALRYYKVSEIGSTCWLAQIQPITISARISLPSPVRCKRQCVA